MTKPGSQFRQLYRSKTDTVEFYDSDDEDGPLIEREDGCNQFRTMPNPEIFLDFMIDAARPVEVSTRLRKFILRHGHSYRDDKISWNPTELLPYGRHFELCYLRFGVRCNHGNKEVPVDEPFVMRDRIYWRVGDRWRPDARAVDAWRSAVGSEVKCCFLKDFYDQNGRNMSWQPSEDLQWQQYVGEVEWKEPGRDASLELSELRHLLKRGIVVHGSWPKDSVFNWY
ncbi:hypothetical protein BU25DRAFT_411108 [Macroventuria anomochaeta]|uniref:Uncharacterized protein n=1 Tax=Macroventuria anomochaeta TaxID=301207 RepID=A0ACB6RYP7_9PLEO|nr:uncharacterized protein BU25DRAFT_411108 [Macroventuria anomochaeta]KAF2627001.1 hypothetical protein BU25DRAFT_411108 [Macroventuria anomochaeta]